MEGSIPETVIVPQFPRTKVQLIPWDPESEEHFNRLYEQRVVCGWKVDKVEGWKERQRKSELGIHWVVSVVFFLVVHFSMCSPLSMCLKNRTFTTISCTSRGRPSNRSKTRNPYSSLPEGKYPNKRYCNAYPTAEPDPRPQSHFYPGWSHHSRRRGSR